MRSCLHYKRAFTCHLLGRYDEAIVDYTMFIEYDRENVHKGYLSRGLVHNDRLEYDKALKDIKEGNHRCPKKNSYYQYCLIRAHANIGHKTEATTELKNLEATVTTANSTSNESFGRHFYYGVALYESPDYAAALQQFEKALQCRSTKLQKADTRFYMGLAYYSLGEMSKAKEEFAQTLQLNENHDRAYFKLGMMYGENDDSLPLAIKYLTRAHELTPHKYEILYERGELYYRQGKLEASLNDKRQAMQMKQSNNSSPPSSASYEVREKSSR